MERGIRCPAEMNGYRSNIPASRESAPDPSLNPPP